MSADFWRRAWVWWMCALIWVVYVGALTPGQEKAREEMVSMRDGVKLVVSIYVPPTGSGPWPVVLSRTPYGKDNGLGLQADTEKRYPRQGYVRVLQDARGKFKSEGVYRPFASDLEDGYDTIEWIARQPWSNGKIGIAGASALGIAAYAAAMSQPPHLVAGFVEVANGTARPDGGVPKQHIEDWSRRQGVPRPEGPRPTFRDDTGPGPRDFRSYPNQINVPFFNVGGYYDIFEQGTIDAFEFLEGLGAPSIRGRNKLVLGPFGHGAISGDLKYPDKTGIGIVDPIPWFDYWLKGIDNGILREPNVRYFVMGDTLTRSAPGNEWRTSASWPPKATATSFYLAPSHRLTSGRPAGNDKASYIYDPRDPVKTVGGNNLMLDRGPLDQRRIGSRPDVLKFETEVLKEAVEVAGPLAAELMVSTDAADTDFMVKLVDVYPNGYEAIVNDGAFRLRYVDGFDKQTRIQPGTPYTIAVNLWSTALVFNAGHKIAVHVSSSNFPRFERHTNTWDAVPSYDQSVKATNTVFLNGTSRMVLPVVRTYPANTQ
jgi:predicted acyl esterase